MKKSALKNSLEKVIKNSIFEINLTGDLRRDLNDNFHELLLGHMFYLPRKPFGFTDVDNKYIRMIRIEGGYCYGECSLYLSDLSFTNHFNELIDSERQEFCNKYFVAPLTELMEQMKQYYIDHNITPKSTD